MKRGLLGENPAYSFSPLIHSLLGDDDYEIFSVPQNKLRQFIEKRDFDFLNVTIPYKRQVASFLDDTDETAKETGSVNTIVNRNGRLTGYNTDVYGFDCLLGRTELKKKNKALILGTGGAAHSVYCSLKRNGFRNVIYISRVGDGDYKSISHHADTDVIVNATPVGRSPDVLKCPDVDISVFKGISAVFDLNYVPLRTRFMLDAEQLGIPAFGGLCMLVAQAVKAREIFEMKKYSDRTTEKVIYTIETAKRNIVLVGMPGSGKTTLGKLIADKLGMQFIDTDEIIGKKTGMKCSQYIKKFGEKKFREAEKTVVREVSLRSGSVIATGGGAVLDSDNNYFLRSGSIVIYIKRPLNMLSLADRPLSYDIEKLYEERKNFYESCSDFEIDNCGSTSEAVEKILKKLDNSSLYGKVFN